MHIGLTHQPTALLSVYHKEGIVEFATGLAEAGWRLLASGGTCDTLREAGLELAVSVKSSASQSWVTVW